MEIQTRGAEATQCVMKITINNTPRGALAAALYDSRNRCPHHVLVCSPPVLSHLRHTGLVAGNQKPWLLLFQMLFNKLANIMDKWHLAYLPTSSISKLVT